MNAMQVPLFWAVVVFVAVSAVQLALAFAVGWRLGGRVTGRKKTAREYESAAEIVLRLHEWTNRMAGDMVEHRAQVDVTSDQIKSLPQADGSKWKVLALDVVQQIVDANEGLQLKLTEAEGRLHEQANAIRAHAEEARTDALTELANRRAYDDELQRRFSEWRRKQTPLSVTLLDIDHFKQCNDRFGHAGGDAVLRSLAKLLKSSLREMDYVARYGGEEFAVVHPATTLEEARAAAERIRSAVTEHTFRIGDAEERFTLSAGCAQADEGEDPSSLLARADAALYAAKSAGRNRVCWHDGTRIYADDGSRAGVSSAMQSAPELDSVCNDLRLRLEQVAGNGVATATAIATVD